MNKDSRKYVYCSGPLFCPEEIASMGRIAEILEDSGFGTFLPHRDGLEKYVMKMVNDPRVTHRVFRRVNAFVDRAIFALDIYQIVERCDYLVFNMNGRVPDEGGVAETAVAFAAGKPLVIYKQDVRTEFNGSDNSMITGLAHASSKTGSIEAIPAELKKAIRKAAAEGESRYRDGMPPFMKKTVRMGHDIWKFMGAAGLFAAADDRYLDLVKKLIIRCEKSPLWKELGWD